MFIILMFSCILAVATVVARLLLPLIHIMIFLIHRNKHRLCSFFVKINPDESADNVFDLDNLNNL